MMLPSLFVASACTGLMPGTSSRAGSWISPPPPTTASIQPAERPAIRRRQRVSRSISGTPALCSDGARSGLRAQIRLGAQAVRPTDRDRRAVGHEGGDRCRVERLDELRAVDACDVALESGVGGLPHAPARVLDAVLERATAALGRVPPVVLGDELLVRAVDEGVRVARRR